MTSTLSHLTDEHLQVLSDALDLYARIHLGQIDEVVQMWVNSVRANGSPQTPEFLDEARILAAHLKMVLTGFAPNASRSIAADETTVSARVSVDVRDAIQHRLAWDRQPDGGFGVWFREPARWGPLPLVVLERSPDATASFASTCDANSSCGSRDRSSSVTSTPSSSAGFRCDNP